MPTAAVAILSYNGYTFDGSSKVKVRRTAVRDEAERTIVGQEVEIVCAATITTTDGNSTDAQLDTIKAALFCDGGALSYSSGGVGTDISVNAGETRDLKWGPKTDFLMWEPIGSHGACEVVWRVVTFIPTCPDGETSGVIALNYEATYDIDELGDTTRTISGYYEIAQTRLNNDTPCASRSITDTVDRYRSVVVRKAPVGFTRKQTFKNSKDKSRCDFTVVDRQIPSPNAYPANMTAISGKHSVRLSRGSQAKIRNTISMTITPNRGISAAIAWQAFLAFTAQRKAIVEQGGGKVLFSDLSIEEDLFGRPASFRLEYYIIPQNGVNDLVAQSGLFTPLGTRWDDWSRSLQNSTFNQRGNANLIDDVSNDSIVDPCGAPIPNGSSPANVDYPQRPLPSPVLKSTPPTPQQSYISAEARTTVYASSPTVIHTPNQDSGGTASNINPETPAVESPFLASVNADWVKPPSDLSASIVGAGSGGLVAAKAASSANGQAAAKEIFQSRGRYRWRVQCHGWADRAGYMIPRPSLVTIGGVAAKELHGTFNCACKGSFGGVPVYRAAWSIIYALDSAPTQPIKPNFSPVGTQ